MTTRDAVFREASAETRLHPVPLAHLSVELGHLDRDAVEAGPERLRRHFRSVAPWLEAARQRRAGRAGRISTCLLIDDYLRGFGSPAEVLPQIVEAARHSRLEVDYVGRMSGCVEAAGAPVAGMFEARLVADPPPGTNGSRPPTAETGWLSNGQRSPGTGPTEAMGASTEWRPPVENAAERHSIFMDIELWDEPGGRRVWSAAFLAAMWQLLRMDLARLVTGQDATARPWDEPLPDDWAVLPPVTQLNPTAAPFAAVRTLSVLPARMVAVQHAVRTVLGHVAIEQEILAHLLSRGRREDPDLPPELVDRIDYVFVGGL